MTKLFKNKVLSCVLAFAVLAVSLFTGVAVSHIHADAETAPVVTAEGTVDLLEFGDYLITDLGSTNKYYDTNLADNGETGADWANAIIIDSAEELVYLCKASGDDTIGKYYKVADGIAGFDLTKGDIDLDGTLADNIDKIKASGQNHSGNTPGFQGHFDGNGATVYGAWTNHNSVSTYAGLFSCTKGEVTIKNIHVNKAVFTAKSAAGGIIGYHNADAMCTVTIENCSVTDSYLEVQNAGYGCGVGAILGYGASAPSWKEADKGVDGNGDGDMVDTIYVNVAYNIKNCYVNLDEDYFISKAEDGTEDSGERVCHGGVMGVLGSNTSLVSDCVVIGIKPYATNESTANNDVQHSGLESHFANVYTTSDVAINPVNIAGTAAMSNRNFTGKVFPLTDAQLKGAAATQNMDLDWSVWMADSEGYPELANKHKNVILVDNGDGTHAATCACGFGGIAVGCTYVDGTCACGALLNCATRKTIYWDGTIAEGIATGTGTKNDPYVIKTANEFAWLVKNGKADNTAGKYYKIDDAIGEIVLQSKDKAEAIKALADSAAVKNYFETEAGLVEWVEMSWNATSFGGDFDGNGATVYGLYSVSDSNAGLFSTVQEGAAFHNIALKNSYLKSESPQANYQVGGIAAVTAGSSAGAIWFDGCVVANNYMNNNSTSHDRSGVIIGSAQKMVYVDNCLVYGNDATYGAGVGMPIVGSANNSTIVSDSLVTPDGLELVNDGAATDPRYNNMVRNSIIFGAKPYDLAQGKGSRFNDPKCYVNVLTDADVATDTFGGTEATLGANDEQIKTVTPADLATAELGDAWINTATYPELKSFHDEVFSGDAAPAGAAGHSASCSCGLAGSDLEEHEFVLGAIDNCACSVCGYVCEHISEEEGITEYEGDCVTAAGYEYDCPLCGYHEEDFAEVAGHNFTAHDAQAGADCQTEGTIAYKSCDACGKNYAENAADTEPFENALTDLSDGQKGDCVVLTDEDDGSIVYGIDGNNHWTQCKVCEEPITTEAHSGDVTDNGDGTHSVTCTVCLYESDAEEHNFVQDPNAADPWSSYSCDVCGKVCEHVSEEEGVTEYEGDCVTAAGYEYNCPICGYHEEDFAEIAGHNFTAHEAVGGADCQNEGTIAYKSCDVCNKNYAENAADTEPFENALTDLSDGVVGPCASTATEFEYDVNRHFKLCDLCDAAVEEAAHQGVNTPHGADGHAIECEICNFADDEAPHVFGDDNVCDTCSWECTAHNLVDGDVIDEGDCVTDRVVAQVCDICGTAGDDDVTPAPGHDFDEYEGYEGNCTYGGEIDHKYCAECGNHFAADEDDVYSEDYLDYETEVATPPVEGAHDWNDIEPSEATCEEPGNIAFKICLSCYLAQIGEDEVQVELDFDEIYAAVEELNPEDFESPEDYDAAVEEVVEGFVIAALDEAGVLIPAAHELNEVKEEAATTEKAGTKAHYACANCDKLFADAEGKTEVTATSLVIEKLVAEDNKEDNKQEDDKAETPEGDNSSTSPVTGESAAAVAAVAALMGAAFVIIRKARKA